MNAKYRLARPRDVDATLEVTMSVGDWVKLLKQLNDTADSMSYPAWKFRELISEIIQKAETEFEAVEDK